MFNSARFMTLMVIFPLIAAISIGGFGIARLINAEYAIAAFDLVVAVSFLSLGIYTYVTGKDTIARWASAVVSLVGPLYFLLQLSPTGIFWVYSSTIVFYYLLPLRGAIAFNVIMLIGTAYISVGMDYSVAQVSTFAITIGLINAFSLSFSELTERSIRDRIKLEEAEKEVEALRDLLPICASCKKIRDDGGIWHQMESYMTRNKGTTFSHGLCPECVPDDMV